MIPPLLIAFPISIDDLKARYTLSVYEEYADENLTVTAELLDISRQSARVYVGKGRAHRAREERGTVPAVGFIEIRNPEEEEPPDAPIPG